MDLDLFRLCVALGPVAIYLVMIGAMNLSRRSLLVTGAGCRGVGVGGFRAAHRWSPGVVLPRCCHGPAGADERHGVAGVLRFVLRAVAGVGAVDVAAAADRLQHFGRPVALDSGGDGCAAGHGLWRWAGDGLALPTLGVQLHLDTQTAARNVALVSSGSQQDYGGWRRLERALRTALAQAPVKRNLLGWPLMLAGLGLLAALAVIIYCHPQAIARSLFDMLQM